MSVTNLQLRAEYDSGDGIHVVKNRHGIKYGTCRRRLVQAGTQFRPPGVPKGTRRPNSPGRKVPAHRIPELIELAAMFSLAKVAAIFGISKQRVSQIVHSRP